MDISPTSPARICIYVRVTDIPGDPLARSDMLGKLFCEEVLRRPFRPALSPSSYDYGHLLPGFDSQEPVSKWFIYDLNVTCELAKDELVNIPHHVFFASLQGGDELRVDEIPSSLHYRLLIVCNRRFIPRPNSAEAAQKRARIYYWGGRNEQQIARQMRASTSDE
ncbi:hypothetical protein B0J12DRAFT_418249 [Macrophomina phaseolina]|uniref:Uncharacterized protein n=1 Tax=Macrophomina phaseolina TaxID=35725 RepID=A0ABQ8FRD8_9PEZI|nr:hypothetical protein B0J12DRAFT_418249 [Macrophomina phaseolina]